MSIEAAARTLRLPASQVLMVGDDVVSDVEGAMAAVIESIAEFPRLPLADR